MSSSLRLGFHYHVPLYRDAAGRLRAPGYLGRFLDSLAETCTALVCFMHTPRPNEIDQMDYVLQSPRIEWVDIGPHSSVPRRMLHARAITRPLRQRRADLDALLIRGPSPLLPAMAHAAGSLPVVLLLVGDYTAGTEDSAQPGWRRRLIRLWAGWNQRQERRVARRALTFVNSQVLYDALHPTVAALEHTRTTTLSETDFFERANTCLQPPARLLYAGRLNRAKGILLLPEALARLSERGHDVELDLVGWEDGEPILPDVARAAERLGISARVHNHGYQPLPALFDFYRRADVCVLASLNDSEGFPRALWEAMAHSLPVVATRVGSIPAVLSDGETALLVEPRSVEALTNALERLLSNGPLRRRLIANGFALARENTLDRRAQEMTARIVQWLDAR